MQFHVNQAELDQIKDQNAELKALRSTLRGSLDRRSILEDLTQDLQFY